MFLMIENDGVADLEAFSLLGMSTARDNDNAIGQFGSGASHAILVLLRAALDVVICLGNTKAAPITQQVTMRNGNTTGQKLCFRVGPGNKLVPTSMTLGFGELDWQANVEFALRELISNALDQSEGNWNKIRITPTESARCKRGKTRVFVQLDSRVLQYVEQIDKYFLHKRQKQSEAILDKADKENMRLYRMGVFVRERQGKSVWDYNFDSDFKINESRDLNTYAVSSYCSKILSRVENQSKLQTVLRCLSESQDYLEADFDSWYLSAEQCCKAFVNEWGDDALVVDDSILAVKLRQKRFNVVVLPSAYKGRIIAHDSKKDGIRHLSACERIPDVTEVDLSHELLDNACLVWDQMERLGMTKQNSMPTVKQFFKPIEDGASLFGFCDTDNETVWIHNDHTNNLATIFEELTHYVTGAGDETREFQDFVVSFAGELMRRSLKSG